MKKLLGLGLVILLAAGCGDLFMQAKDKKFIGLNAFSCQLDTKAFSKILESDIKSDIICLQQKIHSFIDLVKTDRPGYISEKTLVKFIQDGPLDLGGGEIVPLVEGLFDLTKLILGGDRGYVSGKDFDRLVSFLIEFNKNIFPVYEYFTTDKELTFADYQMHREKVVEKLALISQEIKYLLNLNRGSPDRLDIDVFLDRFFVDDLEMADKIKSMMFLKKLFLGGNNLDLTHLELEDALVKLPELGEVAYDLAKIKSFGFKEDARTMINRIYLKDVKNLRKNLHFDDDSYEAIFTVQEVLKVLENFQVDFGIGIAKYPNELIKLKKALLGSGGEFFSSIDVITALDHVDYLLEEGSFFYRVYTEYQDELNSPDPLTNDFSNFPVRSSKEEEYLNHFSQIANNYRFFKGSNLSPFFSFEHFRNPLAIFEIAALEYAAKLIMNEYGSRHEAARGGYHLTLSGTVSLMEDIKILLRDQGIINIGKVKGGEVKGAAENLVLMSTLFQYQSDGCDEYVCMEVPEITEFLVGLFTALSVKDFFTQEMQKFCADQVDEYNRIYPECFRANFVKVLQQPNPEDNDRSLADYMPLLSSYIVELTDHLPQGAPPTESDAYMTFITETEAFTRTCKYFDEKETEPVPLRANDAFAVFAGMLNVESTLLKFDENQNNKLDGFGSHNEVLEAYYSTYEGAIRGMVTESGGPFLTRFSRQIFQYLVKYGRVPDASNFGSVWGFAKFLISFNKNADASRTTVATILKVLGEQNAGDNDFKCEECMRDPNTQCVPVKCHNDPRTGEVVCVDDPWD